MLNIVSNQRTDITRSSRLNRSIAEEGSQAQEEAERTARRSQSVLPEEGFEVEDLHHNIEYYIKLINECTR